LSYTACSRSIASVFSPRLPSIAAHTEPAGPRPTTATSKLSSTLRRMMPFKPPPFACDAHCHVFGPAAAFPYDPKAAYVPNDAPFEALQALHQRLGLQRAVIVHASCHGADMRVTLDAIARSGGRYRGTAIIDESYTQKDFERMHEGGIRAVRFNFVRHLGGRPEMGFFKKTVERVRAMRAHLGADFPLMVDANMRWSVDEAIRAARALAPLEPVWLEEPELRAVVVSFARAHVRHGGDGALYVHLRRRRKQV